MKKMDIERVSSEEIVSMFEEAFEEQVAKFNNIEAYGVTCDDRQIEKKVQVNVEISGHAGTPTIDEFRNGDITDSKHVIISRDDIGELKFNLLPEMTAYLSGNDYIIVYESE